MASTDVSPRAATESASADDDGLLKVPDALERRASPSPRLRSPARPISQQAGDGALKPKGLFSGIEMQFEMRLFELEAQLRTLITHLVQPVNDSAAVNKLEVKSLREHLNECIEGLNALAGLKRLPAESRAFQEVIKELVHRQEGNVLRLEKQCSGLSSHMEVKLDEFRARLDREREESIIQNIQSSIERNSRDIERLEEDTNKFREEVIDGAIPEHRLNFSRQLAKQEADCQGVQFGLQEVVDRIWNLERLWNQMEDNDHKRFVLRKLFLETIADVRKDLKTVEDTISDIHRQTELQVGVLIQKTTKDISELQGSLADTRTEFQAMLSEGLDTAAKCAGSGLDEMSKKVHSTVEWMGKALHDAGSDARKCQERCDEMEAKFGERCDEIEARFKRQMAQQQTLMRTLIQQAGKQGGSAGTSPGRRGSVGGGGGGGDGSGWEDPMDELCAFQRQSRQEWSKLRTEMHGIREKLAKIDLRVDVIGKGMDANAEVDGIMLEAFSISCAMQTQMDDDLQSICLVGVKESHAQEVVKRASIRSIEASQDPKPALDMGTPLRPPAQPRDPPFPPSPGASPGTRTSRLQRLSLPPATTAKQSSTLPEQQMLARKEAVLSLDKRCLSCSREETIVLQAFKMACLQYSAGQVSYNGEKHKRADLNKALLDLVAVARERQSRFLQEAAAAGGTQDAVSLLPYTATNTMLKHKAITDVLLA